MYLKSKLIEPKFVEQNSKKQQNRKESTYYSPLRYPGGKRKLSNFIATICREHKIDGHYVEPYAGGAAVGLELLITGQIKEITINDLDRSIYAFWKSLIENPEELCFKILNTKINVRNWNREREIQQDKKHSSILELGFSTFFLNRTNYSGIINGGILGGRNQKSKYLIDSRFDKNKLIERIKRISELRKRIHVYNMDAVDLIHYMSKRPDQNNMLYYFDPPYYNKGVYLYMNHYRKEDHKNIANEIQKIKHSKWIVSYDNADEIRKYYSKYKYKKYSCYHTAQTAKLDKEILFFSHNLDRMNKVLTKTPIYGGRLP